MLFGFLYYDILDDFSYKAELPVINPSGSYSYIFLVDLFLYECLIFSYLLLPVTAMSILSVYVCKTPPIFTYFVKCVK
jgi:hypothetical protein